MGVIYVAGERPGAGSTAVAASLAVAMRDAGHRVIAVKPLTFAEDDPDGRFLAGLPLDSQSGSAASAPVSSLVVEAGAVSKEQVDQVHQRFLQLTKGHRNVIVDGIPLTDAQGQELGVASASFASQFNAKVIGVVPYRRSLDTAQLAQWKDTFGDDFMGILVNRAPVYAYRDVQERLNGELQAAAVPLLGVLAEERFMLAPTVRQVIDLLEGTIYAAAGQDQLLVEHFLIGGLITEWGGNYFGRLPNQGVIVRGGRTDIQMSALNFPLSCLVLTACESPSQYVYQRAEAQDVPLVVVASDTHEATATLEQMGEHVTVHHLGKVHRLANELQAIIDWDTFNIAAGLS